jgi:hypothetical protein
MGWFTGGRGREGMNMFQKRRAEDRRICWEERGRPEEGPNGLEDYTYLSSVLMVRVAL